MSMLRLVHRGRCADDRQCRVRNDRDLPVPRLPRSRQPPVSVGGFSSAAARARLDVLDGYVASTARRAEQDASVRARRRPGFAGGRHLVRGRPRGSRFHPRAARRVGHGRADVLRHLPASAGSRGSTSRRRLLSDSETGKVKVLRRHADSHEHCHCRAPRRGDVPGANRRAGLARRGPDWTCPSPSADARLRRERQRHDQRDAQDPEAVGPKALACS